VSADLIIKNCRPMGGAATDMLVRDGHIAELGAAIEGPGAVIEDAAGALLLPGLVEAHTHLDKTLWGMGWHKHTAGPRLIDKIDNERASKRLLDIDPARQSARQILLSLAQGSTHIRSHVDIDTDHGMWGIEGLMATRERYREVMDVEIVAFPQSGMLRRPGTVELMAQAMRLGSEVVGGLDPCAIDRDPKGHLDVIFGLAQRHGRPIDIHLHEPGEMGAFSMELIFERTRALGMHGKVTVSHAFCLGTPDHDLVDPLIQELAALDIAIMTTAPASCPAPPVRRLREAGIRVCSGSDGIRDSWGPYGNADMLERAMFIGLRNNFRRDDDIELAFDVCTHGGAAVMGLKDYGLLPGCAADFLLIDAETIAEAVVAHASRRLVVKRGTIVARDGKPLMQAP
jgi:cytosine/creatinine deaminase